MPTRVQYRRNRKKYLRASRAWKKAHREEDLAHKRLSKRRKAGIKGASSERRFGLCPICSTSRWLVCDHDHYTGEVRGWICGRCNAALGLLEDDPFVVRAALDYIEGRMEILKER